MPARFGVSLRPSAEPGADPAAEAQHAESLGFDLVTLTDHLPGSRPTLETWTHLTWLAAATDRILIGTNVLGLPYRNPAVLAKMGETLHRLSGGRLILGIGAGASNDEFRALGLEVRKRKEKIDAFRESVGVIRRLWSGEVVSFQGEHYRLEDAQISPSPRPPIPLWFGSYGPRGLALVGRLADGWIPSMRFAPPERWRKMRDRVRRAAEEAGRDPDTIEFAYNVAVRIDERADPRPHVVAGPAEKVVEELRMLLDMGVTLPNLWPAGEGFEQRERLAAEVLPALRSS
jgi:probable F420-dependent oxidoreductase